MCGIAGIVTFDPRDRVDERRLTPMRDVMRHRGPDGEGLLIDGPVGLAHRRLAIVDVSAGHQPMSNEDGSVWIVFNGEIYNHAELRPGLERAAIATARDRTPKRSCISTRRRATRVVDDLHGMFAFAIWDRPRQRLLLARDRLGIKPLYYALTDTRVAVRLGDQRRSSPSAACARRSTKTCCLSFWRPGSCPARRRSSGHPEADAGTCPRRGRRRTASRRGATGRCRSPPEQPPATVASCATRSARRASSGGAQPSDERRAARRVPVGRHRLERAGRHDGARGSRADPDVRGRASPKREANELPYARLVADAIGAEHREVVVTPAEFFEALPHLIWHEDEPIAFPSSVPLYFVSRLARDHVKVVLTGEGADELFLGYNRYRVTLWNARLGRPYWARDAVGVAPRRAASRRHAAAPGPAVRRAELPRARTRHSRSVLRELRGVFRTRCSGRSCSNPSCSIATTRTPPVLLLRRRPPARLARSHEPRRICRPTCSSC